MNIDYIEFENRIKKCSRLYIYGAGIIGYGVYKAIFELYDKNTVAFIVSDKSNNSVKYAGVDVIDVHEYSKLMKQNDLVVVATPPEYHNDIERTLTDINCFEFVLLIPELEYGLMGAFLKKEAGITCVEDIICETDTIPADIKVFMAVSHNDKELKNSYTEEDFVLKMQVGKSNTDVIHREAAVFDDYKDNISSQNNLYGELTATYSIWKHYQHEIVGIFHYRRTLDVKPKHLVLFNEDKIDVILPLPFVCYPDASGQYGRYLCSEDVEIMKEVVFKRYPEFKEKVIELLNGPLLYNYNMLIAKKEVFNDYCEWLFPMLEEITDRCEKIQRERMSRYIGRIGEVFTSLYFLINDKKWKITHAPKIWRV